MAAGAWQFYNSAKKYLMDGTIDLDTDTFRMALFTSASNAATDTLSTYASVNSEVTEQFGYSSSGKAMSVTWGQGASAKEQRFDATAVVWSAVGGDINSVKYAVIFEVGNGKLVCRSALSTAQFNVTSGNTLTVTPSANGIFELN